MLSLLPDIFLGSSTINSQTVVSFPSQPYTRLVLSIFVTCNQNGPVQIFRGLISGVPVDGNPFGATNTLNRQFVLPRGQALFVVWPSGGIGNARLSAMRDDS